MKVALLDVCQAVGLNPIPNTAGLGQRAFGVQIAGCDVVVCEGLDQVGRRTALMRGIVRHPRSIATVEATMPADVASHEQGVAFLAYYLAPHWGDDPPPQWARDGEQWADQLPWKHDQLRYTGRPHARVRRDRIRPELQALRTLAAAVGPDDLAKFAYDGEILRIRAGSLKVALMADGEPWPEAVQVRLAPLRHLSKRIMQDPFPIDIWDGHLGLGRLRIPLIDNATGGDAA